MGSSGKTPVGGYGGIPAEVFRKKIVSCMHNTITDLIIYRPSSLPQILWPGETGGTVVAPNAIHCSYATASKYQNLTTTPPPINK